MTEDRELAMAYADGELDMLTAKRFEKRMAEEPVLAELVERHRRLRDTLAGAFAPVAEAPVPDALAERIRAAGQLVDLDSRRVVPKRPFSSNGWMMGGAIAASLVFGLMLGRGLDQPDVAMRGGALVAQGSLGTVLDRQLASTQGDASTLRVLVSFKAQDGRYCRAFQGRAVDGIACKGQGGWQLRATQAGSLAGGADYRQAGSADAALLAQAQGMMAGAPLDANAEAKARAANWR